MSSVYKKKCSNWLWNDQTAKVQVYFYFFIVCIISVSYQGSHWSVGSHWYCVMWLCACRHYPVGVLFDLYGSTRNLPWNLTVHYEVSTFGGWGGGGWGVRLLNTLLWHPCLKTILKIKQQMTGPERGMVIGRDLKWKLEGKSFTKFLFLQKQTQDVSLLRIFQLSNIVIL